MCEDLKPLRTPSLDQSVYLTRIPTVKFKTMCLPNAPATDTSQVWLGFIGITYRATFFAGPQSDVESK